MIRPSKSLATLAVAITLAGPSHAQDGLPNPGFEITTNTTALPITNPQNDFLHPEGVAWGFVGANVQANGTAEYLDRLFATAKVTGMPVFVSPH